jgi:ubiquinone biosynthesis monooxygenase Coq6
MLSLQLARRLPTCSRRTFASAAVGARPAEQDITIIGGGPAGLALLASLARSPVTAHLRTTLVEAGDLAKVEHWNETEGVWTNRVSSVTNENRRFLEGLSCLARARVVPS